MSIEVKRRTDAANVSDPSEEDTSKDSVCYGYARVSTREQNLSRQLDAFEAWGIARDRVFSDKASGKDFERPQYRRLMKVLKRGDVVVIKSIDRLGRDYDEIIEEWRKITKTIGADVVVLDMPLLDTRVKPDNITGAFIADPVLQVLSYVAQVERENTRQRQAEGIASAKARGVRFGRPRKPLPENFATIRQDYLAGCITRGEAAKRLGCGTSTFDRWLRDAVGVA